MHDTPGSQFSCVALALINEAIIKESTLYSVSGQIHLRVKLNENSAKFIVCPLARDLHDCNIGPLDSSFLRDLLGVHEPYNPKCKSMCCVPIDCFITLQQQRTIICLSGNIIEGHNTYTLPCSESGAKHY